MEWEFFGKSVNGTNSNAKPVQKVDAAEVRILEAGNLSHCVALKNDKVSKLNNNMEIMQVQFNSNKELGNVGKKNAFIKPPIYCFYCGEYNDKNVHLRRQTVTSNTTISIKWS